MVINFTLGFTSGLLQQVLNTKLESWKAKQQAAVSKLAILQKESKNLQVVQKFVAEHQRDAYKNVSISDFR